MTEFLLSMTKIPSDDILEGLYKLRIRESEKLKTVLELYNVEIHQKKAGPDYHRLKTMVKRSIEQNLRIENFEARNGNSETNAVVKNQVTIQDEQRTPEDCWQWKTNGQYSKGDNCSFCHDINKRAKTTQPNLSPSSSTRHYARNASRTRSPRGKVPVEGCFDCDKSATALLKITRQLGCVFQDMEPPKSSSIFRKSSNIRKPIRCVNFTKSVVRRADIRDQKSIAWNDLPGDPHQRNPNAPKFEDRSQDETERQEGCAREAAWRLAKSILNLKEKIKQHSSHFRKIGACLRHQILNLRKENLLSTSERRCS